VPWWRWGGWSWGAGKWWKFSGYHPDYFRIDLEYLEWRCTWDIYRVYIYKYNYIYICIFSWATKSDLSRGLLILEFPSPGMIEFPEVEAARTLVFVVFICIWLVVWNMFFPPYIGNNHPNWLSYFLEG
jgi:hypothetical protein